MIAALRTRLLALKAWLLDSGRWLLANPTSLAVVIVAGGLGSGAGVPAANQMYTYMWRDPNFCNDCHVHDYANDRWEHSVHGKLTTCHDCHRVAIRHYPLNLIVTLFDTPEKPEDIPKAEVGMIVCEQCHLKSGEEEPLTGPMTDDLRHLVAKVDDSPLHKVHLSAKGRKPSNYHGGTGEELKRPSELDAERTVVCLDCHGGDRLRVHRFVADSSDCEQCHEGIRPKDEAGRELECLDCHARGFEGATTPETASAEPTPSAPKAE